MIDYNVMAQKLHGEYRTVFEKAELYSDMNGVHETIKEDRLMNLLDLLMTAEADGKPASDIIGTNVETFCKDYFADYDISAKISKIPEKIYDIAKALLFILLLDIFFLDHPTDSLLQMHSDILPMICGLLIGLFIAILFKYLIGPVIFRSKKIPSMAFYILFIIIFITSTIAGVGFISGQEIQLPTLPFLASSIAYIVIYLLVRSIIRYRNTGSIRKPKPLSDPEYELSIKNLTALDNDTENAVQKSLVKRFQRINRRRIKRGTPALTTQQYIDKIYREDKLSTTVLSRLLALFYIYMGASILIGDIRSTGIGLGTGILLAVLLAVYLPLYKFCHSMFTYSTKIRTKILENWKENDVILPPR